MEQWNDERASQVLSKLHLSEGLVLSNPERYLMILHEHFRMLCLLKSMEADVGTDMFSQMHMDVVESYIHKIMLADYSVELQDYAERMSELTLDEIREFRDALSYKQQI